MLEMKTYSLFRKQFLPIPVDNAWEFFSSPKNLSVITPKKMNFEILSMSGGEKMHTGQLINYKVTVFPFVRLKWVTEITGVSEPNQFIDEQRKGPYTLWRHTHRFKAVEGGIEMTDEVQYALPLGILGVLMHRLLVKGQVNAIFDYRFKVLERIFKKASR
jgi:ligand-binding SRPBCC domain-containing protein